MANEGLTQDSWLADLLAARSADTEILHERYLNPFHVRSARRNGMSADFVRAGGAHLYDRAGRQYLDLDAGSAVFNIGRNHPLARSTLAELLASNPPSMVGRHLPTLAGLLAEKLAEICPGSLDHVLFTSSGSETAEAAMKLARYATRRPRFLYSAGDYHGSTYGALSVTDLGVIPPGFEPMLPGCWRFARENLDELTRELAKGDVAALLVELIQGADVHAISLDFLRAAAELCRKHGTLLIVDEVFTGLGRTGSMFAIDGTGLAPDMLMLSKSLSAGYVPVGALMIDRALYGRVFDRSGVFIHGSTFEHNDMAMAAGLATLRVLEHDQLVEHGRVMAGQLRAGLEVLARESDMIAGIRGRGLLLGIEFKAPTSLSGRLSGGLLARKGLLAHMVMLKLFADHNMLTTVVLRNNILRLTPPLVIDADDVRCFLAALAEVLTAVRRFPQGIPKFVVEQLVRNARHP